MPKSPEEKRAMNRDRVAKWRKANPGRKTAQDKAYRLKRVSTGLKEVRGIWAKPEDHNDIKKNVKELLEIWEFLVKH